MSMAVHRKRMDRIDTRYGGTFNPNATIVGAGGISNVSPDKTDGIIS